MRTRPSALPLTLADLVRVRPLASARPAHLAAENHPVREVVLAETFDRLRRAAPHALVVLHAEAASGGWSLAAALHLAWERNLAGVVVIDAVAGPSGAALARRLNLSLLTIDADPIDVALKLAAQVSFPDAARALRQALCAEVLAEQHSIRGVLGVLNDELAPTSVALVAGTAILAGRAGATAHRAEDLQVSVAVGGESDSARLVATIPAATASSAPQVEALLRLARPALLAAWARTRLDAAAHAAQESAAFGMLRRLAADARTDVRSLDEIELAPPTWSADLGWQVEQSNRAVWLTSVSSAGPPAAELTHLVRGAWQRGRPAWPFIAEDDGWISWHSTDEPGDDGDAGPLRRALTGFREVARAYGLVAGIGRAHSGVAGLLRSVSEARLAAHVARQAGPGEIQWFDQVGAPAALAWLPVAEIAQVADLCLTDLMAAHDRTALVATVLAVLDCGGSLLEAANRLGVHRNTVLARTVRARQLGLAFDDSGQRLAVHVLCYALVESPGGPASPIP